MSVAEFVENSKQWYYGPASEISGPAEAWDEHGQSPPKISENLFV